MRRDLIKEERPTYVGGKCMYVYANFCYAKENKHSLFPENFPRIIQREFLLYIGYYVEIY